MSLKIVITENDRQKDFELDEDEMNNEMKICIKTSDLVTNLYSIIKIKI